MEQYPDEVVIHVTDPRTGAQRGLKFPPTIAEIVSACDAKMADIQRTKRYQNWGKNEALLEGPREPRPTLDELKAKYGKNWGLTPHEPPAGPRFMVPNKEEIAAHYREYSLQFRPRESGARMEEAGE